MRCRKKRRESAGDSPKPPTWDHQRLLPLSKWAQRTGNVFMNADQWTSEPLSVVTPTNERGYKPESFGSQKQRISFYSRTHITRNLFSLTVNGLCKDLCTIWITVLLGRYIRSLIVQPPPRAVDISSYPGSCGLFYWLQYDFGRGRWIEQHREKVSFCCAWCVITQ